MLTADSGQESPELGDVPRGHLGDIVQSMLSKQGKGRSTQTVLGKRERSPEEESTPKRLRLVNQDCGEGISSVKTEVSNDEQAIDSSEKKFTNRILTCLAISPAGRPLKNFNTVPELLRAFRDAIKAHRSLFLDGKILHRDVSKNNIIITDPEEAEGSSGVLIDMDLAAKVKEDGTNERSEAQQMTGTLEFIAIEVLEMALPHATHDLEHTYRHDLESLLYVFLDICISCGWPDGKKWKVNPLQNWYTGSYENIVRTKIGDMGTRGFESIILPKFSPTFNCVKGLARSLRDALFLKGDLYTGTPEKPSRIYDPMVKAFDNAIEELES